MTDSTRSKIPIPSLCLVTDRTRCAGRELVDVVEAAVDGGVNMVQLREKDLPASEIFDLGSRLVKSVGDRALLFVNDRVDVALACGADGVQIGERGLLLHSVEEIAGDRLMIGRSVHDPSGAVGAENHGADFLILGTVFPSASHPGAATGGIELIRQVVDRVSVPVLAIGGVDPSNVGSIMRTGASGAAVIGAIMDSPEPALAARELLTAISAAASVGRTPA